MKSYFAELAEANRYINRTWWNIMASMSLEELDRPQGAFFGSIFGTWNHLLLTDRIWIARFEGKPSPYASLRERITHTPEEFRTVRAETDESLVQWVQREPDFMREIVYRNTQGKEFRSALFQALTHLFAHQSHHRGHISQMCHERKIAIPDGGLIEFYRQL